MTLCILDCESTSRGPDRLAWDIAMIRRDDDGNETEVSFFVDVDLSNADPESLEIGRFYERHPYGRYVSGHSIDARQHNRRFIGGYRSRRDAAITVAKYTHGATVVGAVPSFDTDMLARLLREHGLVPAWHYRLRCVESITSGHLGREVGGLRRCAEALGIEVDPEAEHTALGDARVARDVWNRVMKP